MALDYPFTYRGRWVIGKPRVQGGKYYFPIRDKLGVEKKWRGCSGKTTESEGFDAACERCDGLELKPLKPTRAKKFREAFEEWWPLYSEALSPSTRANYREMWDIHLRHFGQNVVRDIQRADIEKYIEKRRRQRRKKKDADGNPLELSLAARKKVKNTLSRFFDDAIDYEWCTENPTKRVRIVAPKKGAGTRRPKTALTADEARQFVQAASESKRTPYLYPYTVVGLLTGIRRESLMTLRWEDVDLHAGLITRPGVVQKNGQALRTPMHPSVREVLHDWKQQTGGQHGGLVFPPPRRSRVKNGPVKNPARFRNPARAFAVARKRAGLPETFTIHCMRDTFSTWLAEAGVMKELRLLLRGDKMPAGDTEAGYLHLAGMMRDAIDELPNLLEPNAATDTSSGCVAQGAV